MHSSRMGTARSLLYEGVSLTETALDRDTPPGQRRPWTEPNPSTNRALPRTETPQTEMPLDRDPLQTETSLDREPPCGQTDICENITFTNFLCGR